MNIFMLALLSFLPAFAIKSIKIVNNGGDTRAIEFVQMGQLIAQTLARDPDHSPVDPELFESAVLNSVVGSVSYQIFVNGQEKDAENSHLPSWPGGWILFNKNAWDLLTDPKSKINLVAHEYLGILGIDDEKYVLSERIANLNPFFISGPSAETLSILLLGARDSLGQPPTLDDRKAQGHVSCTQNYWNLVTPLYFCRIQIAGAPTAFHADPNESMSFYASVSSLKPPRCAHDACTIDIDVDCQSEGTRPLKNWTCLEHELN